MGKQECLHHLFITVNKSEFGFISLAKTESVTFNLLVLKSLAGWIFLA